MSVFRVASLAALAVTAGCVSDSYGYAPQYPPGYDSGMGSGQYVQPGDLFGGQNVADVRVFYGPLAQYGQWTESQFGTAFRPNVDANWRPYVNGRWGENRLWLSDDPWGWATDHYGRWGYDQRIGWVWVPGTDWAPSWVAWREDEQQDVAGWAPIPPGVAYSVGVGFGSALAYNAWNDWYAPSWVWVPRRNIYAPGFGGAVLPWRYGQNYWRGSHWNHNGGWNGRPPGYGYGYGRPPNGRPPGYTNGDRPPKGNWAGNGNPGRPNPGQSGRPTGAGDAADAGQWVGRPGAGQTRPPSGQYRPPPRGSSTNPNYTWGNGGQRPPRNAYNTGNGNTWQGRPPGSNVANAPPPQTWQRPDGGRPPGASGAGGRPPAYAAGGNAGGNPNGNTGNRPQGAPLVQRPTYAAAPAAPPADARPVPPPPAPRAPPSPRNSADRGNERPQ